MKGGAVTLAELLALVGRAWSRLLLYPGGLSLIAMAWLVFALEQNRFHRKGRKEREGNAKGTNLFSSPFALFAVNTPAILAAPWLAVALLPLPGAVDLGRSIDVVVALALLDVPLFATLWAELRGGDAAHEQGAHRLAAAFNGYPLLLLALLLLAATTGSLELRQLANIPAAPEQAIAHWFGVAALVLALPAALGIGAFAPPQSPAPFALALRFRQVGMFLLGLLPLLAPFTGLWQLGPPPLLALALWAFDRATNRHRPRRYALGYVFLVGMVFGALLLLAVWQLNQRL